LDRPIANLTAHLGTLRINCRRVVRCCEETIHPKTGRPESGITQERPTKRFHFDTPYNPKSSFSRNSAELFDGKSREI
jgi:hypothetical protein